MSPPPAPACRTPRARSLAARQRAARSVVRAPISGVAYGLAAQPGAYLTVGAPIANIGRLDRVRVRVYVDEPELGRVAIGQPVTIRWQALAGKEWKGTVEHLPSSVQALGSRQVGEVVCTVENPARRTAPRRQRRRRDPHRGRRKRARDPSRGAPPRCRAAITS